MLERDGAEPLSESGAILVHLAEGTEFLPEHPNERAQALKWLFFEQTAVIPGIAGLRFRVITERIRPDGREVEWRKAVGNLVLQVLDERLETSDFLAGDSYSVADISVYAYMHDLDPYPQNARAGESRSIYD